MKRLSIMIMAVALVLGMAQCKKEKQQQANENGDGQYVSVTAGHNDSAKTDIFPDGLVKWSAGDKLYVVGSTQGYLGYLTTVNYTTPSNYAEFGGNITAISGTQTIHFYYFGKQELTSAQITELGNGTYNYSITSQDGTLDGIENTMHLMHGVCANVEAGTTKFGNVTMHNMMAIAKFNISGYYGNAICTGPLTTATLNLNNGTLTNQSNATPVTFTETSDECYMALIFGENQTLTFSKSYGSSVVTLGPHDIAEGKLYSNSGNPIDVKHSDKPGALSGRFSVSDSHKVNFSQGNLKYIGSASPAYWTFSTNQWEYLGSTTGQNSSTQNVDRDIFSWGTSGYSHGANRYQPWELGYGIADYHAYGNSNANLYDGDGRADWGYNKIRNGGNVEHYGWRTLKGEEMIYLLNQRNGDKAPQIGAEADARFAAVKVNDVCCMLIFPDSFEWPLSITAPTTFNTYHQNWNNVNYTLAEFGLLEDAGAVILPAAGFINGTSIDMVGTKLRYYTSSLGQSAERACRLEMTNGGYEIHARDGVCDASSVRLVIDVNP